MGQILNYILGGKKEVKAEVSKNSMFNAQNSENADEGIIRALNSVKLLSDKIQNLSEELKTTNFDIMSDEDKNVMNIEIQGKIQVISKYISTLNDLALNLVNNPKYKNNEKGNFLNLNFLTIMSRIKVKNLNFNHKISHNLLISQLSEIKRLLDEIKFKN